MKEITVAANCDNLDKVTAMLEEYLDSAGAPVSAAMKISVAMTLASWAEKRSLQMIFSA